MIFHFSFKSEDWHFTLNTDFENHHFYSKLRENAALALEKRRIMSSLCIIYKLPDNCPILSYSPWAIITTKFRMLYGVYFFTWPKFFIFLSNRIIRDSIQGYKEAQFRERKDLLLTPLYSLKTRHASGIQPFFLCPRN